MFIVAGIASLFQYSDLIKNRLNDIKPDRCLCCGRLKVWPHGKYPRKADRTNSADSLNPIWIQRYYCPACHKTFSVLPECLPPRRWYLWEVQQVALMLALAGVSFRAIENKIAPSRRTIRRWLNRFKEQIHFHKDILCGRFIELGRTFDFAAFWRTCLNTTSLAEAMRLCHASGVPVP